MLRANVMAMEPVELVATEWVRLQRLIQGRINQVRVIKEDIKWMSEGVCEYKVKDDKL